MVAINDLGLCTTCTVLACTQPQPCLSFTSLLSLLAWMLLLVPKALLKLHAYLFEGWSEVITPKSVWWNPVDQSSGTALPVLCSNSDNPKMFWSSKRHFIHYYLQKRLEKNIRSNQKLSTSPLHRLEWSRPLLLELVSDEAFTFCLYELYRLLQLGDQFSPVPRKFFFPSVRPGRVSGIISWPVGSPPCCHCTYFFCLMLLCAFSPKAGASWDVPSHRDPLFAVLNVLGLHGGKRKGLPHFSLLGWLLGWLSSLCKCYILNVCSRGHLKSEFHSSSDGF